MTLESSKRFRVALSFPGEQRPFVARVAERLATDLGRQAVLYDAWCEAEFARSDLDTYLQSLYHDHCELIAVLLCADYERKEWCGLEWRAVRDLIKLRRADSVMPLRLDDTAIPGLFSIDGSVWIGKRSSAEIAEVILERLRLLDQGRAPGAAPPGGAGTPASARGWPARLGPWFRAWRFRLIATLAILLALGGLGVWFGAGPHPELAGTILDGAGRPIPGVTVALPEQGLHTQTDALGRFTLEVPGRGEQQVQLIATGPGLAPHRQYVLTGSRRLSFIMRPE
ncbi:toll/interleukin-1 receptor domain-containing protein [Candidatus Thiodictyon syntrophicum]|uniref:TIR domain-containing protein n=1 Tax=Candidatus Thiodictyon syntrophicum TaxID=1166950 RepID=A0A2K8UA71_9GAMM|nr:TIR domain-containing protein [Candidatus Thiodictyon syntrophicum]AUB82309.1 hypothetical protein THSYN_16040 [Candidatus Thiodictyon syntrophicum]